MDCTCVCFALVPHTIAVQSNVKRLLTKRRMGEPLAAAIGC
tara:strand:+ start:288 stop:410 length:123 start_codon:yes stop_codon:yes gene_type:complete